MSYTFCDNKAVKSITQNFMIKLSQRDSRWARTFMTPSNLTLGRYGCTTTCLSMLSDYFDCFILPNQAVNNAVKYTKDGLIIWQALNFPNFKFEKRLFSYNYGEIEASLKDPDKAVIFEVDHSHWVVGLSRIPLLKVYRIADPWYGDVANSTRYGKITGSAHFVRR